MTLNTVGDLIACLERYPDETPIALASQPTYPFEYTIVGAEEAEDGQVYLIEGAQVTYLSNAARQAVGWQPDI